MSQPKISMICAIAKSTRAIGLNNQLLWDIPEDMQHFRQTTLGHAVIMGLKTYLSIGKALPNRYNIVMHFDKNVEVDDASIACSVEEAIEEAQQHETEEIFVIGGGMIYQLFLPYADKLYLTLVEGDFEADAFFPEYEQDFTKTIRSSLRSDENFVYEFVELER